MMLASKEMFRFTLVSSMMFEDDENEYKDIEFLKEEFDKMKHGQRHQSLHEDDFEALIDHYEVFGDKENLRLACEMSTEIYPFSSGLLLRKAEWLLSQKKTSQALSIVEKIKDITPGDMDSLLLHAEILLESDKPKEAVGMLEQEVHKFSETDQVFILMELAEIYDEQTEFEKVYDTLKRVLELNPNYDDALLRMCFWADITKQQEDCIRLHKEILEESPFYATAWYNLGLLYQSVKNYTEATESYEYCLALDSKYEYALRNLGECYIQQKMFDKAIIIFEEHLELTKPEDIILETIAYCWERKKRYAKARHYYRRASHLSPEDDTIFYKIGETYVKEQQWEKAIKSYSVALHLNKDNVTYCLALGNCLMELEAEKEALVCYLNAVKLRPDIKSTWVALTQALYHADYLDEGLQQLQLAAAHCGDKVEFVYYQSGILLALGKTKEAQYYFEQALERNVRKVSCLNKLDKEILKHPVFSELYARTKKK